MKLHSTKISQDQIEEMYGIIVACGKYMQKQYGLTHWYPPNPVEEIFQPSLGKEIYAVKQEGNPQTIGTFTIDMSTKLNQLSKLTKHPESKILYISKLAILPEYQGKGIGTWCMKSIEQIAMIKGCSTIRLDAFLENTQLLKFYHCKLGYDIKGYTTEQDEDDIRWKLIIFEKSITI